MQDVEIKFVELNHSMGGRIERNVPLAPYTTFKIGGPATFFFVAKSNNDLVGALSIAKKLKIPFFILAGGANILISDDGIDKLVIQIATKEVIVDSPYIIADSGAPLSKVVDAAIDNGLEGMVWASGIPGTVGGAVRGNAGAYGGEIADNIEAVEILRGNRQFVLTKDQLDFGYRESMFKHNSDIILIAKFRLKPGTKNQELRTKSEEIIATRNSKLPKAPTAGSFFKNIPITSDNIELFKELGVPESYFEFKKVPAGWLLDKLDMRGFKIGGAMVSNEHGNVIVNTGNATAKDVLELVSIMKTRVRDEFGIQLQEEVQVV